jgi:hypothetical protein
MANSPQRIVLRWFLGALVGLAGSWGCFYVFFRLLLGIASHLVLFPWAASSLLCAGFSPFLYLTARFMVRTGGDIRPLAVISAGLIVAVFLILVQFSQRVGLMHIEDPWLFYALAIPAILAGVFVGCSAYRSASLGRGA